ncbi:hypothetical protein QBC39DRAFT_301414 [Podospora conica]|nr:hypothetical protein QBC39DRAFT_301414 [Schizothecium conicum]
MSFSTSQTSSGDRHNDHGDAADDVDGNIYPAIEGFHTKFFEAKPWSSAADRLVQASKADASSVDVHSHGGFATWLSHFQFHLPGDMSPRYAWLGKALVLSPRAGPGHDVGAEPGWADIMVVGEFRADGPYRTGFLNLCCHARAVFAHQPSRLFLHGFYVCRGQMELWVFDRSGLYGSEAFEIAQDTDRFLTVLVGYMLMEDAELGASGLIQEDSQEQFVECESEDGGGRARLDLGEPTIFARVNKDIISDGLTCYRARQQGLDRWDLVVKMKWSTASAKSDLEVKMLQLVKERKIRGVLQLFSHQTICTTDTLHKGLRIKAPRELRRHDHDAAVSEATDARSALEDTVEVEGASAPGNKIFTCIVVSPLGESLHRFQTVPELLLALRDAIRAHRSLYQDAGILHQDICPGNIITPIWEDGGILIDLDSAKMASEPGKQFEGIGTPPFQAIGVLQAYLPDNPHTYRHDLESFLYTFLFLATCQRPVSPGLNQLQLPSTSILYQWTQGRPVDQARRKTSDMAAENFGRIIAEFTPEFKRLGDFAEELRGILFPTRDGRPWTGTDTTAEGTNALYDAMIGAFDGAIARFSGSSL